MSDLTTAKRGQRCADAGARWGSSVYKSGVGFDDPSNHPAPPAGAIGYPSRDTDLDVRSGSARPPAGYGELAFYWWLGDPLTKDRLLWQLDQLKEKGISGLQVDYAHGDVGGLSYGLTYENTPRLLSEDWWNLYRWFLAEAKERGMAVSLSDYTLCTPGQVWYTDEIIKDDPSICGRVLYHEVKKCNQGEEIVVSLPDGAVSVTAYRLESDLLVETPGVDLRSYISGSALRWRVPEGHWAVVTVSNKLRQAAIDPMNPRLSSRTRWQVRLRTCIRGRVLGSRVTTVVAGVHRPRRWRMLPSGTSLWDTTFSPCMGCITVRMADGGNGLRRVTTSGCLIRHTWTGF